jgi:hypothetical protein
MRWGRNGGRKKEAASLANVERKRKVVEGKRRA